MYLTIKEISEKDKYPVELCCRILRVTRSAYYKWNTRIPGKRELENQRIAEIAEQIHTENPDKGYRRINDDLAKYHGIHINDKRALRICRKKNLKSTIKYTNNGCTRSEKDPQIIAENVLNREFHADAPNEKWLTDVTEFKWYEDKEVHKIYLSAILDLYDKRIVSYVIGDRNNNPLVFETLYLHICIEMLSYSLRGLTTVHLLPCRLSLLYMQSLPVHLLLFPDNLSSFLDLPSEILKIKCNFPALFLISTYKVYRLHMA